MSFSRRDTEDLHNDLCFVLKLTCLCFSFINGLTNGKSVFLKDCVRRQMSASEPWLPVFVFHLYDENKEVSPELCDHEGANLG